MTKNFGQLLGEAILEAREKGGFTQIELAQEAFGTDSADSKVRRIRELETGQVPRPQPKTYQPICDVLNIERSDIRRMKAEAADAKAQEASEFQDLIEETGSVEQAVENPDALRSDQLDLLAERFEISNASDLKHDALIAALTQKAKEYRAYRDQIELIDDRTKAMANLKGAARDAADRLEFEEVEMLLSRVAEVEAEIFASTQEARAANALLRNRPDQAYTIYTTAAEAFRDLDIVQMAARRNKYWNNLYEHGLRYGGTGLTRAAEMIRPAIEALSKTEYKTNWAAYTQNLANALAIQGSRAEGAAGNDLLAAAVAAYRTALTVLTKSDHPVDWALTQQNLANTLNSQGSRTAGAAGNDLLAEAVAAYRTALTIFTKSDHPLNWAMTQNNLANALATQGIGTAGAAGNDLLAEAVAAYRAALTVTTKSDHPVAWAETMENIAIAYEAWAQHDTCDDPRGHLETALEHIEGALTVFDPDHMPYHFNKASEWKAIIETALAEL